VAALVLLGVRFAPELVGVLAPGFDGPKRELTARLVRIMFPGVGTLVLSAWCLGILNSHRRFFLPYVVPVLWNVAIVTAVALPGAGAGQARLAIAAAWGSVAGSVLMLLVQLPTVLRLVPRLGVAPLGSPLVRTVLRNFGPALMSRGVVQISAFVDQQIATLLGTGALSSLGYAQTLYLLPVSLFGMSISAAALPAMAADAGGADAANALRARLVTSLERVAFFVIPCAVAFLAVGDVIAAMLYQRGAFTATDARWVWAVLAGSAAGLLATTLGRLYSSAFFARHDTRTPLRFAVVRVALSVALGWGLAAQLPRWLGIDPQWGTVILAAGSSFAGWVEFVLLRRALERQVGPAGLPASYLARLAGAAAVAAAVAWALRVVADRAAMGTLAGGALILGGFAIAYGAATLAAGVPMARQVAARAASRLRRR
jgi:putative peptidoglycan lipid II flippase